MKKNYAIQNLKEARGHLDSIIEILEKSRNLKPLRNGYLLAFFNEVYWHLNRIWNCRNLPQEFIDNANGDDWDKLCQFPKDIDA